MLAPFRLAPGVFARSALACLSGTTVMAAALTFPHPSALLMAADALALALLSASRRERTRSCADEDAAPSSVMLTHRLLPAHPVSGLPMREALLSRIASDGAGTLGAIAFHDFDRLTAFDPASGERVFGALVGRLRAMLPPERLVAQIDRGKLGIWFPRAPIGPARAELDAAAYALGQPVEEAGTQIIPEIRLRVAAVTDGEAADPAPVLARTLATFATGYRAGADALGVVDDGQAARDDYVLEQDLRQAISRGELRLEFQPLIDVGQGRVSGAEALLRWHSPRLGAVPPSLFVPVMETIGLANEFGAWALNAALRQAKLWRDAGLGSLRIAVNVTGSQLDGDSLPALVQRTLRQYELAASALEIELTESVATSDTAHCRLVFTALREMGVKLAVDDFGTGYSGFSSLRQLAFDKIKIDREFVTDVDTRRDSQAICQSVIALGRGLGIRVLAEGVERRAEYEWLRRHGCKHFQGYYFSRPLLADDFAAFVADATTLNRCLRLESPLVRLEQRLTA